VTGPGPLQRSRRFPETTASVPVARQFVADSLSALGPEVSEMAALLVSELATNAVVHATSDFAVTVLYPTPTGRVRVEVVDGVPGEPMPLRPPPTALHGRGLLLVASLADEWGVEGTDSEVGKTIWFELAPATAIAAAGSGSGSGSAAVARRALARLFRRRRRGLSFTGTWIGGSARYPKRMATCSTPSHQL
jgi:anti-sigma regulatory factor (Ser/Thr protein kinase)